MKRMSTLVLPAVLAGALHAPALPQQLPAASRPVRGSVDAVAAELDVLVLDANGKPVEGLAPGDFSLLVNGAETPIDWLEGPPASPAAVATGAAAPAAARAAGRAHSTVFVISDLHTSVGARHAGLEALRAYAKTLPEGEPAAVYLLDNGARRLQGFTTDRAALNKALEKTAKMLPRSLIFANTSGDEWVAQSRQMLRNFTTVLDSLASRPEPKTVVVLTGTISTTGFVEPVGAGSKAPSRRYLETRFWNFLDEAKDAESRALLARSTIVAIDPTGLETPHRRADTPGSGSDAMSDPRDLERPWTTWDFRDDTFALIATSTGGARLGYSNDPAALLAAETRLLAARYRLGFTPPDGTSLRRDVRVEVARPGVVVRAAAGQRSLTPESAARARFASLLLSSDPPTGDFAIALQAKGPLSKRTEDALPFDVLVPVSGVYAEERGGEKRAMLELLVAAVDEEGRTSEPMVIPFSVTLENGAPDGSFFRKDTNFAVDKRWKGRLFVGVRDTATSRIGAVALPIGM